MEEVTKTFSYNVLELGILVTMIGLLALASGWIIKKLVDEKVKADRSVVVDVEEMKTDVTIIKEKVSSIETELRNKGAI